MKIKLFLSIIIPLIIIAWALAGYRYYQYKEKDTTYSQYEKVRNDYHDQVETQSLLSDHIKANVHFYNDTLVYSLHYLYDPHFNMGDWIKQGEVVNTFLTEIVPFAGVNTVKIKFWKNGQHVYTVIYDVLYYEDNVDSVNYQLNNIKQI